MPRTLLLNSADHLATQMLPPSCLGEQQQHHHGESTSILLMIAPSTSDAACDAPPTTNGELIVVTEVIAPANTTTSSTYGGSCEHHQAASCVPASTASSGGGATSPYSYSGNVALLEHMMVPPFLGDPPHDDPWAISADVEFGCLSVRTNVPCHLSDPPQHTDMCVIHGRLHDQSTPPNLAPMIDLFVPPSFPDDHGGATARRYSFLLSLTDAAKTEPIPGETATHDGKKKKKAKQGGADLIKLPPFIT